MAKERTLYEADATCKQGLFRNYGPGCLILTPEALIWTSRLPVPLRFLAYLAPAMIVIQLSSIRRLDLVKDMWRAWLVVTTEELTYTFRPGKGFWRLKDNPETATASLAAIEAARDKLSGVQGRSP